MPGVRAMMKASMNERRSVVTRRDAPVTIA
jgi:hypothetical protein